MPVLSEIKVRSPKEGDLLRGRAPEALAGEMAACPIAGLSVVTEPEDFGGDLELVRRVRPVVAVPIPSPGDHVSPDGAVRVRMQAGAGGLQFSPVIDISGERAPDKAGAA